MLNFLMGVALCIYIWNSSAEWRAARRYQKRMRALERMWLAKAQAERAAHNRQLGLLTNFKPQRRQFALLWVIGIALAISVLIASFPGVPQPLLPAQHPLDQNEIQQPPVPQGTLLRQPS